MNHTLNGAKRVVGLVTSVLFLCAALSACDSITSADKLKADANSALSAHNFSSAAQIAKQWSEKTPEQYEAFYVLAQAQAQAGDKNAALMALDQAIKKGLKDDIQIDDNKNLDPIKSMSAYESLMKANFPDRKGKLGNKQDTGEVSIVEKDGQQVLRAGDVVIQVPSNK